MSAVLAQGPPGPWPPGTPSKAERDSVAARKQEALAKEALLSPDRNVGGAAFFEFAEFVATGCADAAAAEAWRGAAPCGDNGGTGDAHGGGGTGDADAATAEARRGTELAQRVGSAWTRPQEFFISTPIMTPIISSRMLEQDHQSPMSTPRMTRRHVSICVEEAEEEEGEPQKEAIARDPDGEPRTESSAEDAQVRAAMHAEQAAADELEAARQEVASGQGRPEGAQSASFDHRIDGGGMEQRSWEFVVQGQHDPGRQQDFASKIISCYPDEAVERAATRGCVTVCMRGRRLDKSVPNQDDFVAARHTLVHDGHIALYAVFDGHGPAGHHCAAFARGLLPESLFGQRTLLLKPEETLREAFRQTQAGLLKQPFDTEHSGTTVALALVLNLPSAQGEAEKAPHGGESWLFVAHVGDSRAILASHRQGDPTAFTVTALTRDHRPDNEDEAERVHQAGGEIRKLRENSGAVRVFARGQDRPALALTRTLGAAAAADCGVSSEPEVSAYRLRPGVDALLVLGTDGLFEFCNNTDAAASLLKEGVTGAALQELCTSSQRQWAKTSYNETVDDITAIAAMLPDGKP